MNVEINWKGDMVFQAMLPSGEKLTMDASPDHHGKGLGPTPLETMVGALGACSAMDVISILEKKRQKVTSYRIEVAGTRVEGPDYPRPFTKFVVKHVLTGDDLDANAVEQAVQLSDEKYCSIIATLREKPEISSIFEVVALSE